MGEPIDYNSRSILEYVPDIGYVEPDVVSEDPAERYIEIPEKEDKADKAKSIQVFAQNIERIAENVQKEADKLSKGFEVELKSGAADSSTTAAMRRHFPSENSKKITYEQYRKCKDHLREIANGVSDKVLEDLSEENLIKEMNIVKSGDSDLLSDLIGPNSSNRPEDDPISSIVPPLDIEEFQDLTMRHLINSLWKKFIKPVVQSAMPPGVSLPDKIASLPEGSPSPEEIMGKE